MARQRLIRLEGFEEFNERINDIREAVDAAAQKALREVAEPVRKEWVDAIHEEVFLSRAFIDESVRLRGSYVSAGVGVKLVVDSKNQLAAGIGMRVRSLPVVRFPHSVRKGRGGGVTVKIKKKNGPKFIKSAFKARMRTGHEGVFVRQGTSRLPIKEARTTAVEEVALDKLPQVQERATARLAGTFRGELNAALKGKGFKGKV